MRKLDLPDIQGVVVRGYRMPLVRYTLLKVTDAAKARALLGRMTSGDERDAPQVTSAAEWHVAAPGPLDDPKASPKHKPDYCLNLGITWPGLVALGVTDQLPVVPKGSFDAFVEGAAKRAARVGDKGRSGPENWVGGFGTGNDHLMLTLYAISPGGLANYSAKLTSLLDEGPAFERLWQVDGAPLVEMQDGQPVLVPKVHFGYVDGITITPRIIGGPEPVAPDHQQACEPWLFILSDDAKNYALPEPVKFWRNGSFGVFKMAKQDVVGFEQFLQSHKDKIDPELLAAKLCGRWRNGTPLALSPDTDSPPGGLTAEQLNDFEYVNSDGSGDPRGLRCPVGSHIRRHNPRGQPVFGQGMPGGSNNAHRLIRRGMPYGPTYVPGAPDDGIERGLLGYFINTFIENQYEFVLKEWSEDSAFVGKTRLNPKAKDPLIGQHDPATSVFDIPQGEGPPIRITGFSQFITTQAAAYCFLPSLSAIKWIAALPAEAGPNGITSMTLEEQYQVAVTAVTAPSFRSASAREKQELLWSHIARLPYAPLPSARSSMLMLAMRLLNVAFLRKAFVLDNDVRPPRIKPFHTHGTAAKMRFVADGQHPFTGIFATGGVGFIRASLAVGMPEYSPAIALKFLAEGDHPARNLLLHQSLDRQASRDFFERPPMNDTLIPSAFPNTLTFPLLKALLGQVNKPIVLQVLDHLAEVTDTGAAVAQPLAPVLVQLFAADDVHNDPAATEDFRALLAEIPAGSLLYRMYGRVNRKDKPVYVGSVFLESSFVASAFGDRILAFRHSLVSNPDSAPEV